MTQRAKLYRKFMDGRRLTFREFCALLEAFGYRHDRTTGSHVIYYHAIIADKRVIQPRGKEAKDYQVRQFSDKVKEFALVMEE